MGQAKAIEILSEKDPRCYIVCPCRYTEEHPLFQYSLPPSSQLEKLEFPNQVLWERYYMEQASTFGSLIFWLPCEDLNNPRGDGQYARDTRAEIGRWSIRSAHTITPLTSYFTSPVQKRVNLVIGAEEDFPGLSVIRKNIEADHKDQFPLYSFPIYSSFEETLNKAVKLGKQSNPQPMFNRNNC